MRKNPFVYGLWFAPLFYLTPNVVAGVSRDTLIDDPQLGNKRHELVTIAARRLAAAQMIIFDPASGAFTIKDLGRIAARYYVTHASIEVFNMVFKPKMRHADVLEMLSKSSEVSKSLYRFVRCLISE